MHACVDTATTRCDARNSCAPVSLTWPLRGPYLPNDSYSTPSHRTAEQDRSTQCESYAKNNGGTNLSVTSTHPLPPPVQTLRLHHLVDNKSGNFGNKLTFNGHTKAVSRTTYGAQTRLIYSCSRDTTIRQWNRCDIPALRVFEGHDLACTDLALSAGM